MGGAACFPLCRALCDSFLVGSPRAEAAVNPQVGRVAAGLRRRIEQRLEGLLEFGARAGLGHPPVGDSTGPLERRTAVPAAHPHWDRALYRQRRDGGADDRFVLALEGDDFLRPELPQQTYLLLDAAAAVGEGLAETVVLHVVPADADAETQLSAAEDVYLRRLLGDPCGLALREDQHAGEHLELGQGRDEPEQDKRLVEGGPVVVDVLPARGAR